MPSTGKKRFSLKSNKSLNSSSTCDGLKACYKKALRPVEEFYAYDQFYTPFLEEQDFDAKPLILLLGQYSTGKTTFIRHIIGEDFPGIRIGPEPTTEKFNIIMAGSHEQIIPGNALVVDPNMTFRSLEGFGNAFLNRLQCSQCTSPTLNSISLIDTPGILSGQKQSTDRGYDFTKVVQWFAAKVDRILILFDAHKLDISDDLRDTIVALKSHEDKIRIILNKSDMVESQELMRVYGALMWSLGKVLNTPEVVRVYIGSFWDKPIGNVVNRALFENEEADLLMDLKSLPRQTSTRKLNDFIKRARSAKVHGLIISELANNMPAVFGKDKKKKDLINDLEDVFMKIRSQSNLLESDLPDIDIMREKLKSLDWSIFKGSDKKLNEKLDKMLAEDIPKIVRSDNSGINGDLEIPISNTPFQYENLSIQAEHVWSPYHFVHENGDWFVSKECGDNYNQWVESFQKLGPIGGKLSGAVVRKEFLSKTKLHRETLGKIWSLSDVDQDGYLNEREYCLAMYLIDRKLAGKDLPHELPSYLVPPERTLDC